MLQLEILGRALRWLREDRGMKQEEVAQIAEITRPMLSAYERGRVQPTLDTLDRLLRALDCDLSALSQALSIVTSMGKVGRKRGSESTTVDADEGGAPPQTREAFVLDPEKDPPTVDREALSQEEEAAFQALLEAHRKWLQALRRGAIARLTPSP
jgi:transcriptional regulator with XRE-family HTH domain